MAATLTLVKGPANFAPGFKIATYNVAFDTSYPTGGEAIDLTGDFDYVYAVLIGGNDTAADNGYKFQALQPAAATAVTSSNVLIQAHWSANTEEALAEFTNTGNLSAVGQLSITVIGS